MCCLVRVISRLVEWWYCGAMVDWWFQQQNNRRIRRETRSSDPRNTLKRPARNLTWNKSGLDLGSSGEKPVSNVLLTKAVCTSETSVYFHETTLRYIPEMSSSALNSYSNNSTRFFTLVSLINNQMTNCRYNTKLMSTNNNINNNNINKNRLKELLLSCHKIPSAFTSL
jgi:hypothetical protein